MVEFYQLDEKKKCVSIICYCSNQKQTGNPKITQKQMLVIELLH